MIKSLTVTQAFEKAGVGKFERGYKGFALKAFPVGHVINVDSPLVLLIGDNGTGKSTFLKKLESQFSGYGKELWHFEPIYDKHGIPDDFNECNLDFNDEMAFENIETRSHGEYTLSRVPKLLAEARRYPKSDILYFDEPENGVSLRNKSRLVHIISDYAFTRKRQIFVATHEPEFLKIGNARVINLDEHPATSCLASKFDLIKYMDAD